MFLPLLIRELAEIRRSTRAVGVPDLIRLRRSAVGTIFFTLALKYGTQQ